MKAFCSCCFRNTTHKVLEANFLTRNLYRCGKCKHLTVECRWCKNMAKGPEESDTAGYIGRKWHNECCAEHDGTIASFDRLGLRLKDIAEFREIFERDKIDVVRAGKIVAGAVGGIVVFAPAAMLAGPALAGALGSAGLLGAAGTGTAISTLSGAALSSASMAAIGGGSMAMGTIFVTAAGAALGAYEGGIVSNSYFGKVDHFDIRSLRAGNKHAIIVVNGFMSQKGEDVSDWTEHLHGRFRRNSWYHVDWESKNLHKLGAYLAKAPKIAGLEFAKELGKRALKGTPKRLGPLALANHVVDALGNPWHSTMVKASMTGLLLADAIARTPGWRFTLAGHSLGARVIYYALEALSTGNKKVEDIYLLGGAVGRNDEKGWSKAASAVRGSIYNCYSKNDDVLRYLYRGASGYTSQPAGFAPITLDDPKVLNINCTDFVGGHMEWKGRFGEVLNRVS